MRKGRKRDSAPGLLLAALLLSAPLLRGVPPRPLAKEGKGYLLQVGPLEVLRLEGTPYERGFQQGRLMRERVRTLVKRVLLIAGSTTPGTKGLPSGALAEALARTSPFLEKAWLEELRGLADGAGLPLKEVQEANIFPELFHCSGFALMGKATRDGRLLHGRILDYMTGAGLQEAAVAVVEVPRKGIPFLNAGFAGFLGSVTGMNALGISVGEMGGRGEGKWDGTPMAFLVRKVLEEARTLEEALEIFRKSKRTCEYYYVVSDGKIPDARGLYCTPTVFQVLAPGRPHPLLPVPPVEDAVLMSRGKRLLALRSRVLEGFGSFGVKEALALMERPVSMKSNLQCALMDPALLTIHLAYAADPARTDRFQACFQPYTRISLAEILAWRPPADWKPPSRPPRAGKGGRKSPPPSPRKAPPGPETLSGRIPPGLTRPLPPEKDPATAGFLENYRLPAKGFAWKARRVALFHGFDQYDLTFPSPFRSPDPENNTVSCEFYRIRGKAKRPAVIVLHILDGKFRVARLVSRYLAGRGMHALLLKMAYYGPRRPKDPARRKKLSQDLPTMLSGVRQTVLDIRRAALLLSTLPEVDPERISIAGVSLGGFLAALASGVDGRFYRTAVVLAGGRMEKVFLGNSKEARSIKRYLLSRGFTEKKLLRVLAPIEPCRYAHRIDPSSLLMVNADKDPVVPALSARAFAEAAGKGVKIHWIHGDHYSLIFQALPVLKLLGDHLDS